MRAAKAPTGPKSTPRSSAPAPAEPNRRDRNARNRTAGPLGPLSSTTSSTMSPMTSTVRPPPRRNRLMVSKKASLAGSDAPVGSAPR